MIRGIISRGIRHSKILRQSTKPSLFTYGAFPRSTSAFLTNVSYFSKDSKENEKLNEKNFEDKKNIEQIVIDINNLEVELKPEEKKETEAEMIKRIKDKYLECGTNSIKKLITNKEYDNPNFWFNPANLRDVEDELLIALYKDFLYENINNFNKNSTLMIFSQLMSEVNPAMNTAYAFNPTEIDPRYFKYSIVDKSTRENNIQTLLKNIEKEKKVFNTSSFMDYVNAFLSLIYPKTNFIDNYIYSKSFYLYAKNDLNEFIRGANAAVFEVKESIDKLMLLTLEEKDKYEQIKQKYKNVLEKASAKLETKLNDENEENDELKELNEEGEKKTDENDEDKELLAYNKEIDELKSEIYKNREKNFKYIESIASPFYSKDFHTVVETQFKPKYFDNNYVLLDANMESSTLNYIHYETILDANDSDDYCEGTVESDIELTNRYKNSEYSKKKTEEEMNKIYKFNNKEYKYKELGRSKSIWLDRQFPPNSTIAIVSLTCLFNESLAQTTNIEKLKTLLNSMKEKKNKDNEKINDKNFQLQLFIDNITSADSEGRFNQITQANIIFYSCVSGHAPFEWQLAYYTHL